MQMIASLYIFFCARDKHYSAHHSTLYGLYHIKHFTLSLSLNRLLAEMPDSFVSYLTKNGNNKAAKSLNVEIGSPRGAALPEGSSGSSPSPTNSCVRSRIPTKRPIRLDQFSKYYEENMKDSCYGFSQEFDLLNALCRETVYKQPMLKTSYNMKNRYANILPCKCFVPF